METLSFPGTYRDARGVDAIIWLIGASTRSGWERRFEIRSTIRGVRVWGSDFDGLEPEEPSLPEVNRLHLDAAGELTECVLGGDLPCSFLVDDTLGPGAVHFELDLRPDPARSPAEPRRLALSCLIDGAEYSVTDDWFEDGLQRLEALFPVGSHQLGTPVS
jgi:hypothetical protein